MAAALDGVGCVKRLDSAKAIRDVVDGFASQYGSWQAIDLGGGGKARIFVIDAGLGWQAWLTSRFSGVPMEPVRVDGYDEALLLQIAPPQYDDVLLDLWLHPFGKVLSMGSTAGADTLIGFRPGPWETMFGLPERPWTASDERRVSRQLTSMAG